MARILFGAGRGISISSLGIQLIARSNLFLVPSFKVGEKLAPYFILFFLFFFHNVNPSLKVLDIFQRENVWSRFLEAMETSFFLYLFFGLPWLRELSKDSRSIIFAAQKRRIGSITHRPLEEPPQKKSFEREEFLFCVMADYGGESIMTEHINWFVNVIPNGENAGCRPDTRPYVYMKTNGTFSFFLRKGFHWSDYTLGMDLYTPRDCAHPWPFLALSR